LLALGWLVPPIKKQIRIDCTIAKIQQEMDGGSPLNVTPPASFGSFIWWLVWHQDRRRRLKLLSILGLCLIAVVSEMGRPVIIKHLVDQLITIQRLRSLMQIWHKIYSLHQPQSQRQCLKLNP
jgi:hypothetical protein